MTHKSKITAAATSPV